MSGEIVDTYRVETAEDGTTTPVWEAFADFNKIRLTLEDRGDSVLVNLAADWAGQGKYRIGLGISYPDLYKLSEAINDILAERVLNKLAAEHIEETP